MRIAVDVKTMRTSDARTIESGTDSKELMRRAGESIFLAARDEFLRGKTAVVCGSGNNAGDGYVLAMYIFKSGGDPTIFLLSDKFSGDGAYYFEKCRELGIKVEDFCADTDFSRFDAVADCIFGTGFRGDVCGNALLCIQKINKSGAFTVSADINSGLSGDSGTCSDCVLSDITVSIGFYKPGHFLGCAKDRIKKLTCADIGIDLYGEAVFIPEENDFGDIFYERKNNSHKGTYGYTAVVGGCTEYGGAAKLSNLAVSALRSGCGVTKLAVPASLSDAVAPYLLESTLFPMPDKDGKMIFDPDALGALIRGTKAVSCGMGWGRSGEYKKILSFLLSHYEGTLIIDADGLNTLSEMGNDVFSDAVCRGIILTPHPLEFSRISGFSMNEIQSDPISCAKSYTNGAGNKIILLLKGTSTVVTDGAEVFICDRGCAGMATAGSGDVLSGVITGIMGYSEPTAKAVACAAYTAGLAGEIAQKNFGAISMTAGDTVKALPEAVKRMTSAI